MTPGDARWIYTTVKALLEDAVTPEPADGASSSMFDVMSGLLGKDWYQAFPVGQVEQVASALEAAGGPIGAPIAAQLRALADRIEAERIAAKDANDPLDAEPERKAGETWSAATDQPRTQEWRRGFAEGLTKGLTTQVAAADKDGASLELGDSVMKIGGDYNYPGEVVAIFTKAHRPEGAPPVVRVVVQSTSPGTTGMLHIFSPGQLRKR